MCGKYKVMKNIATLYKQVDPLCVSLKLQSEQCSENWAVGNGWNAMNLTMWEYHDMVKVNNLNTVDYYKFISMSVRNL